MKKIILIVVGLLLILSLIGFAISFFQRGKTSQGVAKKPDSNLAKTLALSQATIDPGFGWSLKYPAGWQVNVEKDKRVVWITRKINPEKDRSEEGLLGLITIEPITRYPQVDTDDFAKTINTIVSGKGFNNTPNFKLTEKLTSGVANGQKWFRLMFEFDDNDKNRVEGRRFYLFPEKTGDGVVITFNALVDKWNVYEKLYTEVTESFQFTR